METVVISGTCEHGDGGGFSGTVVTQQRSDLALVHVERGSRHGHLVVEHLGNRFTSRKRKHGRHGKLFFRKWVNRYQHVLTHGESAEPKR